MTSRKAITRQAATLPELRLGSRQGGSERKRQADAAWGSSGGGTGTGDHGASPFANPACYDDVVWKRIIAHVIDIVIIALAMVPVAIIMVLSAIVTLGLVWVPFAVAFLVIRFAYYVAFTGGPNSATPGMRLLGIEVRTWTGGRPDYLQALVRLVLYYASLALLTPLILVVVLFNSERRAAHDLLSGTVVVNGGALGHQSQY